MQSKFFVHSALLLGLAIAIVPIPVKATSTVLSTQIAQATEPLTEDRVQAIVERLQTARSNEDVEGTLELIAPFAVTVVTVEDGSGSTSVTTRLEGINAHRQMLEQSFGQVQNRQSFGNNVTINIVDDGFAIAEIYQIEGFETSDGEAWISASQTVLRLGQMDGQVMITSATVDGWLSARPAQN